MRNLRRRKLILLIFLALSAHSLHAQGSSSDSSNLEPATLQLKWTHQFQFAGYYMAQELGYYEEEDIALEIRPGSPTLDVTEEVLSGRADFGVGTSSLLLDYAAGKPLVALGVVYQHSPLVLLMRTEHPSDTIENVSQGPLMLEAHSGDIIAMLRRAGLATESLDIIEHPANSLTRLATSPRTTSMSAYQTDEPYTLLKKNVSFNTFRPQTYGIDFYGDNFFTTKQTLQKRKKLTEGFRRATIRGWEQALQDPDTAIALILKNYPNGNEQDKLEYEARITRNLMTNLVDPGHMNVERWEHIAATFVEVGMLDEIPADLDGFIYTNKQISLPKWFWPTLLSISILALLLTLLSFYLKRINLRLQKEVALRLEAENELKSINKKLTIAKKNSEEANQKKTWFITNVSHDLKAPVSAMISLTQIFNHHSKDLKLPEKFNSFLKQLSSGGEFLMLLLDNILDHSAFEMNSVSVCPELVELTACCESLTHITLPLADEKDVAIQLQWHSEERLFHVDRTRLSQILLNLLHNAIKFSPRESVVSLDLTIKNNELLVQVGDQGPGIPPQRQRDLFKMFGESQKAGPRHSSTGLGLSIIKRNIDLLAGTIEVRQNTPQGTLFLIKIPASQKSAE